MEPKEIADFLSKAPDVREDMIAIIKNKVFKGIYEITASQVAESIIKHGGYMLTAQRRNYQH